MKRAHAVVLLSMICPALSVSAADAQNILPLDKIQSQPELDRTIAALDAALFDSYNRCDLQKFASFFVDDVEFYHDQGGVTLGRVALTDSVKKNICGQTTRELVPGTLHAYYMKGYGALEVGIHGFTIPGTRIRWASGKASSFTSGSTRMEPGRSHA
jgi:hypothetical protein